MTGVDLLNGSRDPYREMVVRDTRGEATEQERAMLRADLGRWYSTLVLLSQDVMAQMSGSDARAEDEGWTGADAARWRRSASRFRAHVDAKIREVKTLQKQVRGDGHLARTEHERSMFKFLAVELLDMMVDTDGIEDEIPERLHDALRECREALAAVPRRAVARDVGSST